MVNRNRFLLCVFMQRQADLNQAIAMVSYYASSSEPAQVRGKTVYVQYSNRQEIVNSKNSGDVVSNVLLVTIEGVEAGDVSIDVLHLVSSTLPDTDLLVQKTTTFWCSDILMSGSSSGIRNYKSSKDLGKFGRQQVWRRVCIFHATVIRDDPVKVCRGLRGQYELGFPQGFKLALIDLCKKIQLLLLHGGVLIDTWIEFDWKLHGSAGPCDGHILNGSLVHGEKAHVCVCFPSFVSHPNPPSPSASRPYSSLTPPGNVRSMWIYLSPLSIFSPWSPLPFPPNPSSQLIWLVCPHSMKLFTSLTLICWGLTLLLALPVDLWQCHSF